MIIILAKDLWIIIYIPKSKYFDTVAKKANVILGYIKWKFNSKSQEIIAPFYLFFCSQIPPGALIFNLIHKTLKIIITLKVVFLLGLMEKKVKEKMELCYYICWQQQESYTQQNGKIQWFSKWKSRW